MSAPQPRGASGVTYSHAAEGYFDKRGLTRTAGFWGLWGLGVAAVISGDFSGWNFGIGGAGWGGFLLATAIVTLMYVAMIASIGEMASAMPHTGGAYSFARSAMGPWGGFVTGLAETSEYLVPTGMSPDLDEAVQNCVRAAIALLQARFGMDAEHAYAYLSAATDFNISQVVDLVKGVHARIRVADLS